MAPRVSRHAGVNFRFKQRQREQERMGVNQSPTDDDRARLAAAMADKLEAKRAIESEMPAQQLQARMAQPRDAIDPDTFQGTPPDQLQTGQLRPDDPTIDPSAEQIAAATAAPMYQYKQQGPTLDPNVDRVSEVTQSQKEDLFQEDLFQQTAATGVISDENAPAFAEAVEDSMREDYRHDDGMMKFSSILESAANSFNFTAGKANLFGTRIDITEGDQELLASDPQRLLFEKGDAINFILRNDNKLNLSVDPKNPNSNIKREAGRAAAMAVIMALSNKMMLQNKEIDEANNEKQHASALNRGVLGPEVGRMFERMLYPTQMDKPEDVFKGVTEGYGYQSRLTPEEHSLIGQVLLQGFADSKIFDFIEAVEVTDADNKKTISFKTTRAGDRKMSSMRKGIRRALGLAQLKDKPVSLLPTDQGRMRGEGATFQKQVTASPERNVVTPEVQAAIDALSSVQHTVAGHATTLYAGVLMGGLKNRNSVFAKMAKQDEKYLVNKRQSLLNDYLYKHIKQNLQPEEVGGDRNKFLQQGMSEKESIRAAFEEVANAQAIQIQRNHLAERSETLSDGINRANVPFYYAYTVINNSSRMMIANDELNYQSDKLARFLVSGGMPALFTVSSGSAIDTAIKEATNGTTLKGESGFFRVIARSLVLNADKLSVPDQLKALKTMLEKDGGAFRKLAAEVYNYREQNKNYTDLAKEAQAQGQKPPQPQPFLASEGLEAFLSDHADNDTFYFALDALHELHAYTLAKQTALQRQKDGDSRPVKFATRVKAEVDGNSNGAVIQASQMGVENILKRGGVLYLNADEFEGDIREDVFRILADQNKVEKEDYWQETYAAIGQNPSMIKKLMKSPIMTSIYGKDPEFHQDTAKVFIDEYPELFEGIIGNGLLSYEETIKALAGHIEKGLTLGLGGALEHSKIVKRAGRIFTFADSMFNVRGANGYLVMAGGIEYLPVDPRSAFPQGGQEFAAGQDNTARFRFGEGLRSEPGFRGRSVANIQVTRAVSSPSAAARSRNVGEGERSKPDIGSKLRNQAAVNLTQNIDATIAQRTVQRVINNNTAPTVMQVYDAFMGDANSFDTLAKTANDVFNEVNAEFNMLEAEYEAFKEMLKEIRSTIESAKVSGETFDIGTQGKYKAFGDFFSVTGMDSPRMKAIMRRDMPDGVDGGNSKEQAQHDAKQKAFNAVRELRAEAIRYGYFPQKENVALTADQFSKLFEQTVSLLNVENDFKRMISEINSKGAAIQQQLEKNRASAKGERKSQYS